MLLSVWEMLGLYWHAYRHFSILGPAVPVFASGVYRQPTCLLQVVIGRIFLSSVKEREFGAFIVIFWPPIKSIESSQYPKNTLSQFMGCCSRLLHLLAGYVTALRCRLSQFVCAYTSSRQMWPTKPRKSWLHLIIPHSQRYPRIICCIYSLIFGLTCNVLFVVSLVQLLNRRSTVEKHMVTKILTACGQL